MDGRGFGAHGPSIKHRRRLDRHHSFKDGDGTRQLLGKLDEFAGFMNKILLSMLIYSVLQQLLLF